MCLEPSLQSFVNQILRQTLLHQFSRHEVRVLSIGNRCFQSLVDFRHHKLCVLTINISFIISETLSFPTRLGIQKNQWSSQRRLGSKPNLVIQEEGSRFSPYIRFIVTRCVRLRYESNETLRRLKFSSRENLLAIHTAH